MFLRTFVAAGFVLAATPALAGPLTLSSEVKVEKRVAAPDGTTRMTLVNAARAVPGDKVIFVLTYRNTGNQPLSNVVLANPMPKNISYRAANPGSAAPELSVDGQNYGALPTLRVTAAGRARPAGPDDVTTVRWRLASPIAAGAQGQLAFQAVIK